MAGDIKGMVENYAEIEETILNNRKYGVDDSLSERAWLLSYVEKLHPHRLELKVSHIFEITKTVKTIRLVPVNGYLPPFQAGQYIQIFVNIGGVHTGRPYSISSSPVQRAHYDITIRRKENAFVSEYLLERLQVGDILTTTAPAGHFHYNPIFHGKKLVFLAGGSGITPFLSMIREVTDRGLDREIHLLYGCRTPEDAPYNEELKERAAHFPNFTYDLVISDPDANWTGAKGLITADLIKNLGIDFENSMFYICGPQAMYDFCIPELQKLNIPKRRIRKEIFGAAQNITADPGWPAEIAGAKFTIKFGEKTFPARANESILTAIERAGLMQESRCRSGECSLCRVKLLSGNVFQSSTALLRKADKKAGYIHSCVSYPISDLEITN